MAYISPHKRAGLPATWVDQMGVPREIEAFFLIADLSGYTALAEAHGNVSAANIATRFAEIVHEILDGDTRLVDQVGDEVLIVSADAATILRTAIRLCNTIEQEPFFPTIHAGIHAGKVLEQNGRYFGTALNLASRVAAHARGGQILCTEQVVQRAGGLDNLEFRSLGKFRFKNIRDEVSIVEVTSGCQENEAKVLDPVCHMRVERHTAPARLPFEGRTYYFCSLDCAKAFAERPDAYLGT
jgi:adenylate cyclase